MKASFIKTLPLPESRLMKKFCSRDRTLHAFTLEITARCNNHCRHCYINLSDHDQNVMKRELSLSEIKDIVDQAVCLGALWCLVTGGEPLLRKDFFDIYLYLKKKGLLVSVFTNATLMTEEHVRFFKKYPPRDIEVTVYGTTQATYERISRNPGSFNLFLNGLELLRREHIPVRFKAMALRSNLEEFSEIAEFCRLRTRDFFRFDPFLHLRFDGNKHRNNEIQSERLTPQEIVFLEENDVKRFGALQKNCDKLIFQESSQSDCHHLFRCGAGNGNFTVSFDGKFRLCSSLWHPDCMEDLRRSSLKDAYHHFVRNVRGMCSSNKEFLSKCHRCSLINLCLWCPAHAHLELGALDVPVDYFCETAHARAASITKRDQNRD